MKRLISGLAGFAVLFAIFFGLLILSEPKQAEAEPIETEPIETEPIETELIEYDVPLTEELQQFVIDIAESYGLEPTLIFAVIEKESIYNPDAIGDSGESKGLMQIQEKWHRKRMESLGVKDLMNPFDNILVGVDILAEKVKEYGLEGGLVAYNQGHYNGHITAYAKAVLEIKEELDV